MGNILKRIQSVLPTQRRLIQLYSALLYNAHLKGYIKGNIYTGSTKFLCVPGLNCYSCPGAVGACPLGALQNAVASAKVRMPAYVIGILMLYGLLLGRTICGFLCPFGLLQELLHKIPTPKLHKSRTTRKLSWIKYGILAFVVLLIPLAYAFQDVPVLTFCKYICPAGTFEGALGLLSHPANTDKFSLLGALFTNKFIILISVAGICVFVYRAFCRFLCPLGAIYGLFAKVAIIGVRVEPSKCVDCGRCLRACRVDIRHVGDHECIQCGECIDACPTSAISFKAGRYIILDKQKKPKKKYMILIWILALVLLASMLFFVNQDQPSADSVISESSRQAEQTIEAEIGYKPGMKGPLFSATVYKSNQQFHLNEHKNKVVVINFWATWCQPCIKELPHFDAIARMYPDDVAVIAVHSHLVTENVEQFLSKYDYQMTFAHDQTGDIIKSYGGSTMLPQTIVLDRQGVVVYNAVGSVTQAELEALVNEALLY